jgi:glycosyltransferase involved in cell wall biosynthesis
MVTGAYHPETSGASLQCRALVKALQDRARFAVLTTATNPALPLDDQVDGVAVARVPVDVRSPASKAAASIRLARAFLRLAPGIDIVHLHGFSQKSIVLTALARWSGKKVIVKLTSVGHDDPMTMKRRGGAMLRAYAAADRFVGVSPRFGELYADAALPGDRLRLLPNGVDLQRFRPALPDERIGLRRCLGLPLDLRLLLFVGFFSHDKAPTLLFDAWLDVVEGLPPTGLVFVGQTGAGNAEVDPSIADEMRATLKRKGLASRVTFVERSDQIERYYDACDVFVLPSLREGLPNVVLEAMASGLPTVVSRLPGVTDWLIADGRSGRLVPPGDRSALAEALREAICQPERAAGWGRSARTAVEERFGIDRVADQYLDLYRELIG